MRYYPVKLQRNLCAVSVRVLPVKVRVLCLLALLFPVSDSFTPLDYVLKGGLSHRSVGLMPRVLHRTAVRRLRGGCQRRRRVGGPGRPLWGRRGRWRW